MRVIELSKQDKGRNWNAFERKDGSSSGAGSSGAAAAVQKPLPGQPQQQPSYQQPQQPQPSYQQAQPAYQQAQQSQPAPGYGVPQQTASPVPENDQPLDINTATRVRALYNFSSEDVGELNFERGDVIKVLDRGFKEWWRGAARGKIGIFPVTYVEPLPEPSPRELQEEAQEEARVFASLGLVDKLLQMLSSIDTARGDRLDDRPELEEMYQASVSLQGQINALIKKYSDQKAELEHMNANFHRAMRQYEELRSGVPQQAPQPGQQRESIDACAVSNSQLHTLPTPSKRLLLPKTRTLSSLQPTTRMPSLSISLHRTHTLSTSLRRTRMLSSSLPHRTRMLSLNLPRRTRTPSPSRPRTSNPLLSTSRPLPSSLPPLPTATHGLSLNHT